MQRNPAEYLAVSYRLIDQMETSKPKYRRNVSKRTRRLIERDLAERGLALSEAQP